MFVYIHNWLLNLRPSCLQVTQCETWYFFLNILSFRGLCLTLYILNVLISSSQVFSRTLVLSHSCISCTPTTFLSLSNWINAVIVFIEIPKETSDRSSSEKRHGLTYLSCASNALYISHQLLHWSSRTLDISAIVVHIISVFALHLLVVLFLFLFSIFYKTSTNSLAYCFQNESRAPIKKRRSSKIMRSLAY